MWWEGHADKLASYYSQGGQRRSFGFDAGMFGLSVFWGKRPTEKQVTTRLHLPIAADLVQTSANLLFADGPKFKIADVDAELDDDEDGKTVHDPAKLVAQERVDFILNTPQMHSAMLVAAETCAALGGVWPRIVWDQTLTKNAWIHFEDPDRAIPEFKWGRLSAVTFWSELDAPDKLVWRHLERYEPGKIFHALYQGSDENLGQLVPLEDHPATAGIKVNAYGFIETGSEDIAAGYIPNQLPNPIWRTEPQLRPLGRPDISDDIIPLLDQVDETWSSLMRDLRLGRARAFMSENMTKVGRAGEGAAFDNDRELFSIVGNAAGKDGAAAAFFEVKQFAIRVEEHLRIAQALVLEIIRRSGYSPLTFGISEEGGAATATEITARTAASSTTRTAKHRLWGTCLTRLARTLLEVDGHVFPGTRATVDEDIEIEWPPMRDSAYNRALTAKTLREAKAASTETIVALVNPDWDSERVRAESNRILEEDAGPVLVDPSEYGVGGDGAPDDANTETNVSNTTEEPENPFAKNDEQDE
ncbi:hypothetical protein CH289_07700 [Rhodococcus sp. RS1C4]|nr:hypothetical protein CH289_07700 [Rhodococcus sp. RS1C4]